MEANTHFISPYGGIQQLIEHGKVIKIEVNFIFSMELKKLK